MCLARIEFVGGAANEGRGPLTDIARIDRTASGLNVTDLTGTVGHVAGRIQSIDFIESVVRIEEGKGSFQSAE